MVFNFEEFDDACSAILDLSSLANKIVVEAYSNGPQPQEVDRFISCFERLRPIGAATGDGRRAFAFLRTNFIVRDELDRITQLHNVLKDYPWCDAVAKINYIPPGPSQSILDPQLSQLAYQWHKDQVWCQQFAKPGPPGTEGGVEPPVPDPAAVERRDSQQQSPLPQKGEEESALKFVEGGYILWGKPFDLTGKPLAVLKGIAEGRLGRKTSRSLLDEIWGKGYGSDQSVKDAVCIARNSLREAFRSFGVAVKDPIPCLGKGTDLAWKLELPPDPNSIQSLR